MARLATQPDMPTPIGQAPAFLDMLAHVSRAAPLNRPVLVIGERGTGKELVAGRLALLSPRWDAPFIKLNCAALPETLLDSELFGHEAGSFTGAQRRRPGRFEQADRGTIFLDEIATASAAVQEKLLRVIEYGQFERVGGSDKLHVDVRVVAATNVHLPDLAADGRFRPDLLDRLSFDVITVPPLRARRDDIMLIADHFAQRMTSELGREYFPGFAPAAQEVLLAHDWPGNVRELRNVVERSVYRMTDPDRRLGQISLDPFASPYRPAVAVARTEAAAPAVVVPVVAAMPEEAGQPAGGFAEATRAYEARLLQQALQACRFNQAEAARRLGLSYYQFRHHLRVHGMLPGSGEKAEGDTVADAAPPRKMRPQPAG
jgi:psp operon transcriptional activator